MGLRSGAIMRLDETWAKERILNGLSSGEGLIYAVRDPVFRPDKKQQSSRDGFWRYGTNGCWFAKASLAAS